jgi:hypothetical protein
MGPKNSIHDNLIKQYAAILPKYSIITKNEKGFSTKHYPINIHTLLECSTENIIKKNLIKRSIMYDNNYSLMNIKNFIIHNDMSTIIVTKNKFLALFKEICKHKYTYTHLISSQFTSVNQNSLFSITVFNYNLFFSTYSKNNDTIVVSFRIISDDKVAVNLCFLLSNNLDGVLIVDNVQLVNYQPINLSKYFTLLKKTIVPTITKINKPKSLKSIKYIKDTKDTKYTKYIKYMVKKRMTESEDNFNLDIYSNILSSDTWPKINKELFFKNKKNIKKQSIQ